MFLASILSLFKPAATFVWKPVLTLQDPQIVSTLLVDNGR